MSMVIELVLNMFVATLLGVTIVYCYILNKRIQILQNSKGELAELLGHFDESTRRASESILALQVASKKIGDTIQTRIDKANFAIDDLRAMVEKAERATDTIEAGFAIAKQKEKLATAPSPHIQQVREAVHAKEAPATPVEEDEASTSPIASLQTLIGKVASRTSSDPALRGNQKITPGMASRPPSDAEQELLQALRIMKV